MSLNANTKLKIFLETEYVIRQVQETFSTQLLAISYSEFYVKEVNASVSFRKSKTTNDNEMVIYQNGMGLVGNKVH